MKCEHTNFICHHQVNRKSELIGGEVTAFTFQGDVRCADCGHQFRMFEVRLRDESPSVEKRPALAVLQ